MAQMKFFYDLDSVTIFCPCGASITGEGEALTPFIKEHKPHCDEKAVGICTDDGARCLGSKPEPWEVNL